MGLRGPPAKPTALKAAQGNPGRRQLTENEPVPPPGPIAPPAWVTGAAAQIWNDLAPVLIAMRTLTTADRLTFGRYCVDFARFLELKTHMWDRGWTGTCYPIKDKKGKTRFAGELPQAAELRRLHEILVRLEDRFGLSPSARTRLRVAPLSLSLTAQGGEIPPTYRLAEKYPTQTEPPHVESRRSSRPPPQVPTPPDNDIPF